MYSLLIVSPDKIQREQYAIKVCQEKNINAFDISIIESEQALGIDTVRIMQKTIFLKPFKGKEKAIIIHDAHTATVETQNALLKILEEPPLHTLIILTASYDDIFLPTILSRCKLIRIESKIDELSPDKIASLQNEFQKLINENIGYKMKLAQELAKDKEQALSWLSRMIKANRFLMLKKINQLEPLNDSILLVRLLQNAHTTISNTNVNLRFLLENTFIQIGLTS